MQERIEHIALKEIYPSPGNRRVGGFDQAKLEQLAESIRAVGVQQPAVVREQPNGQGRYEMVAGERRWRAAGIAGLGALPCVVRDLDDVTVLRIQTIENLQREDIHPLDEADGYARLIERARYDVEQLAQEVGRSISYVYQRLKLRELVEPARQLLIDGKIAAGHAVLIARLPAGQQTELLKESWLFRRGEPPTVRQVDDYIHTHILLDLSKAAFKKDDPDLDPQAGPCTTCPKRTGYQPALFADVCNGKRDYCTDPPCFNGKLEALIQRRRIEFQEAETKILEVADGYLDYQEEQRLQKGKVRLRQHWEECRKKDDGAVRCLVVAGAGRGRITWGRERKTNRYGIPEKTAKQKAREKAERQAEKAAAARRRAAYDAVIAAAAEQLAQGEEGMCEIFVDDARAMRIIVGHAFDRLYDQLRKKLMKLEGWEIPSSYEERPRAIAQKLAGMSLTELRLLLLKCTLVGSLEYSPYNPTGRNVDPLLGLAEIFGVDVSELRAEVGAAREDWDRRYGGTEEEEIRVCRVCGCTDEDCTECVEATGQPCHWVEDDLCSRCAAEASE